ncbi:MAG: hypothetical protein U1F61_06770 [Opitutaceae bacterium]
MRVALSEPSPIVSFQGTDYVIRVARVRSLPADDEPDLFSIVAFARTGAHHIPLSPSFTTLEGAQTALRSGFQLRHRDPVVEAIVAELQAQGVVQPCV